MSSNEILNKAIQKAIDGGFNPTNVGWWQDVAGTWYGESKYDLIFNHDFAKALWDEGKTTLKKIWIEPTEIKHDYKADGSYSYISQRAGHWKKQTYKEKGWQYHLQQMVIAKDPIKYLGENF